MSLSFLSFIYGFCGLMILGIALPALLEAKGEPELSRYDYISFILIFVFWPLVLLGGVGIHILNTLKQLWKELRE